MSVLLVVWSGDNPWAPLPISQTVLDRQYRCIAQVFTLLPVQGKFAALADFPTAAAKLLI